MNVTKLMILSTRELYRITQCMKMCDGISLVQIPRLCEQPEIIRYLYRITQCTMMCIVYNANWQ